MPLRYLLVVTCCVCLGATWAHAANGIIPIGFGTESVSMGGADLAVARDTSAMNTNPAGLVQVPGHQLQLYSLTAFAIDVTHSDQFGNAEGVDNEVIFAGGGGYAQRLDDRPWWVGVGLFGQSGAGVEFGRLNTAFGTQDELVSLLRTLRLTLTAARQATARLSVGASLGVNYTAIDQKVFPGTSNAAAPFFGYRLKGTDGTAVGGKFGVLYHLEHGATIGVAYATRVRVDLDGGHFISNQTDIGNGLVTYNSVHITGLNLPAELGVGYAFPVGPKWLVSTEVNWINWSGAIRSSTLTVAQPDNLAAPDPLPLPPATHNWRDQYVGSIGVMYRASDRLELYGGYNRARNPIPTEHTSPLFGGFTEQHLTGGGNVRLGRGWHLSAGLEYVMNNPVTYTNPELPFGTDTRADLEFLTLHVTATLDW